MSLFLAHGDREVVALDLSREALKLGADAGRRYGVGNVRFVEADLTHLPLRPGAFDLVYCSGVLHHTPDPRAAFASVAAAVRPGGAIVIGLYNRIARLPLRLRRGFYHVTGRRWVPFDPVLRERRNEPARARAWQRDQYAHPEEHRHSVGEVRRWYEEEGLEWLRTYPSTMIGEEPDDLFQPAADAWPLESLLAQLGWMGRLGGEGGLFVTVGRRPG